METGKKIQLAMVLKLQELRRSDNSNITYDQLETTLMNTVWKDNATKSLHEIVNDIFSLSAEDIIRFYSKQAQKEGYFLDIGSFDDILGGKEDEHENK